MERRRTRAKDLRRRVASRPELKTIVVFCEGKESEPDYIHGLKRLPHVRRNASVTIEIDTKRGAPLTLVEHAVARISAEDEVDEVWCVFDVEAQQCHPNLAKAVELAGRHGIRLAISNPSFELWLILHFEDQSGCMTTRAAERRSCELDGRTGKRVDAEVYVGRREAASKRAVSLRDRHKANQTSFPHDNPSSSMHELLASVEFQVDR